MIRVVADTNVFVSAFVYGGVPAELVDRAFQDEFKFVTSTALLYELDGKLRGKFSLSAAEADSIRFILERLCNVVSVRPHLTVIADDPDDDRVLECAVGGHADYIVSGDKHLCRLISYSAIPILTIRQFLDHLTPSA